MRALRRAVLQTVALATAMTAVLFTLSTPAHASTSGYHEVCRGFLDCTLKGYPTLGYEPVLGLTHWGARAGHNCTNYVAYRLAYRSRVTARPPGTASAVTWKDAAVKAGVPVSSTPQVGDVAWWGASQFTGASGHVGIVEQVSSDGRTILVSQDNVGGEFVWSTFTRGGTHHPQAFLRFPTSDGTPAGAITSVTSPTARSIRIDGQASDPDRYDAGIHLLVSVGAPRTSSSAKTFTTSSNGRAAMPFSFAYQRTDSSLFPSGKKVTVYLYAINTAGSKGASYRDLGAYTVTVR